MEPELAAIIQHQNLLKEIKNFRFHKYNINDIVIIVHPNNEMSLGV